MYLVFPSNLYKVFHWMPSDFKYKDKYCLTSPSIVSSVLCCLSKSCFTVKDLQPRIRSKGHSAVPSHSNKPYFNIRRSWAFTLLFTLRWMPLYASTYIKVSVWKDWASTVCCTLKLTFLRIKIKCNRTCILSANHLHNAPPRIWLVMI